MASKEKAVKIINLLIEVGILAIVFLTPIIFSFLFKTESVFPLIKDIVFKIIGLLVFILLLVRFLIIRKVLIFINRKQLSLIFLFFLSIILVTIFSLYHLNSFWGSYLRQEGLITHVFYLLFFLILVFYIKDRRQMEIIIFIILLSSFFVSLFGILQWFGFDIADLFQEKHNSGQRVISTIGQPMILGNYLLLVIFLTVYKLMSLRGVPPQSFAEERRSNPMEPNKQDFRPSFFTYRFSYSFAQAIIYSLILLSQLLCLIFTYSRGAWLGFIFGIIFALFLYFFAKEKGWLKKIVQFFSVCLILVISLAAVFYFLNKSVGDNSFTYRIKSIKDIRKGSFVVRIETWNAALTAISKRPLLGYGPENQYEVFKEYYRPDWAIYESINSLPDRAHNLILDLLLEGGTIELAAYFLFLLYIFIKGIKKLKQLEGDKKWLLLFLLVSIFAYHFTLLVGFSSIESNILFWVYVAFVFLLINDFKSLKVLDISPFKSGVRGIYYYVLIILAVYGAAGAAYFGILTVNGYRADYYYRLAVLAAGKKDYLVMYNNFILAINLNPREDFYKRQYIKSVLNSLEANDSEIYKNQALDYLENAIALKNSDSYYNMLSQARLFTILGAYKDKKYFSEAEKLYLKLNKINPFLPEPYKDWGRMQMYAGDYKKAITIFRLGLSVLPDENDPRLNAWEVGEHKNEVNEFKMNLYNHIGYSYLKLNDYENSIKYYKKIIAINPHNLEAYKMIANSYYLSHNLDMAIWYNKRGYMLNPNDYAWPFAIALLYRENGDNDNALKYASEALKLSFENKNVQEFIDKLK